MKLLHSILLIAIVLIASIQALDLDNGKSLRGNSSENLQSVQEPTEVGVQTVTSMITKVRELRKKKKKKKNKGPKSSKTPRSSKTPNSSKTPKKNKKAKKGKKRGRRAGGASTASLEGEAKSNIFTRF